MTRDAMFVKVSCATFLSAQHRSALQLLERNFLDFRDLWILHIDSHDRIDCACDDSAHLWAWLCRVTLRNPMMFGARRSSGTAEGSELDAREAIVFYRFILRTMYACE